MSRPSSQSDKTQTLAGFRACVNAFTLLLILAAPVLLHAENITGTIKDPSGAVIQGAHVEITSALLPKPLEIISDAAGHFLSPDLTTGNYSVKVSREGFGEATRTVELKANQQVDFVLAIAKQAESVSVEGKSLAYANSDSTYRQLRTVALGQTFRLDNYRLPIDVGVFQFDKGTLTILTAVKGVVTGAIFIGEGKFSLNPVLPLDAAELKRRSGQDEFQEEFTEITFRFTGDGYFDLARGCGAQEAMPGDAGIAFDHWKNKIRHRKEEVAGFTQGLLQGETMDNVDADILASIYNPSHPAFFNAYLKGKKRKDLRFFVRKRVGAVPQLDSPEEVGLINYNPEGMDDGVWYLAHLRSEYLNHTASSHQDRRLFATHSYKIETVIARNGHLFSTATIAFEPLIAGERVLKFGLLPSLRVSRVFDHEGRDLNFIQESKKDDGSFYAILAEPGRVGEEQAITVEYSGDKVLEEAGTGSFYVSARSAWYPNLNGFGERALYDLTYKVPKRFKVISAGKLQSETIEQDLAVSHWSTPTRVAVAGFNYGEYKKLEVPDAITGYKISGYYLTELPDSLQGAKDRAFLNSMSPGSMTKYALEQTRAQLQICNLYFGKSPFEDIYITEQPNFNFGQSWPNLVYLPISAYIDSTQRWLLFGAINNQLTGFVQEVTPHEVAHQWWGHTVGWASYHDQWLSEGFAEFSAGLFLQQGVAGDWRKDYIEFWDRLRRRILEKNNFGVAPNDAGPLWMGLRLISPKTLSAYQNVTYPKGAYVVQMLRSLMWDQESHDKAFIDMMHDFVETHRNMPASTESFKAIAEKHITKQMDLEENGHLNWFFDEWVYGTSVPRYHFEYQASPMQGGKVKLHMTLMQSDVDDHFAMLVPIFGDFGKGMIRLTQVAIAGNKTRTFDLIVPQQPKKVAMNAYKDILER